MCRTQLSLKFHLPPRLPAPHAQMGLMAVTSAICRRAAVASLTQEQARRGEMTGLHLEPEIRNTF